MRTLSTAKTVMAKFNGLSGAWMVALVLVGLMIHMSNGQNTQPRRYGASSRTTRVGMQPPWEYLAVEFGQNDTANTAKLNEMASEGWEYVGLLHHGTEADLTSSVAFRRISQPERASRR